MTVPVGARCDWCPSCEASCRDHPRICTTCGERLQYPRSDPPPRRRAAAATATTAAVRPTPAEDLAAFLNVQEPGARTEALLQSFREVQQLFALAQGVTQRGAGADGDGWEPVPAFLLDPNGAAGSASSASRPCSRAFLDGLPRLAAAAPDSALFRRVALAVPLPHGGGTLRATAVPGELGRPCRELPVAGSGAATEAHGTYCLVVASPRTGLGGALSAATLAQIQQCRAARPDRAVALYMARGGGVTFREKARLARAAGAAALIVGNDRAEPWPYVMRDTAAPADGEDAAIDDIFVLMVKQADGEALVRAFGAAAVGDPSSVVPCLWGVSLAAERLEEDCLICQESLIATVAAPDGPPLLRIPACLHLFHEPCALAWLRSHNTCPTCRRLLPTDDADYERERRRRDLTHAGSDGAVARSYEAFYG